VSETTPQVHAAIAKVIGDMPAIGKNSRITEGPQKYAYRGIEGIKAELKPVLAKHGVHYAPHQIRDAQDAEYQAKSGATWQRCRLIVTYRIYGPDGSYIEAEGRGEGADNSDKSQNKAMTGAEKQMLLQVFAIADSEDPEHSRAPEADQAIPEWETKVVQGGVLTEIRNQLDVKGEAAKELARRAWDTVVTDVRSSYPVDEAQALIAACVDEADRLHTADLALADAP
jgi:hypothetical protein